MATKKKIGIVTITNESFNFGNKLQNYALQKTLESLGFIVETINDSRLWYKNSRNILNYYKSFLHYLLHWHVSARHIRDVKFFCWAKKWIKSSRFVVYKDSDALRLNHRYDVFVAGSDQIWNPTNPRSKDGLVYLEFADSHKKIAYAPSFGISIDQLHVDFSDTIRKFLSSFTCLSIREYDGAEIIRQLIGKKVPVLLDPVFLLSPSDWLKVSIRIKTPKSYIFVYTLGDLTSDYSHYINSIAQKNSYAIIDIMRDPVYSAIGPGEFLYLINNAKYVVTDSFHATAFSIIFNKYFTILQRKDGSRNNNMIGRMDTLMLKFALQYDEFDNKMELTNINWKNVNDILQLEKQKSLVFLKNALGKGI